MNARSSRSHTIFRMVCSYHFQKDAVLPTIPSKYLIIMIFSLHTTRLLKARKRIPIIPVIIQVQMQSVSRFWFVPVP